jgi:hypothetical protein
MTYIRELKKGYRVEFTDNSVLDILKTNKNKEIFKVLKEQIPQVYVNYDKITNELYISDAN